MPIEKTFFLRYGIKKLVTKLVVRFLKYIRTYVAIHSWYFDTSKNKVSINIIKNLQVLNLNMMIVTCLALRSAILKWNIFTN